MCLAIPGKIIKIKDQLATVDFRGIKKEVNISLVKAKIGDYVMVHAGFAIEKMDQDYVDEMNEYLKKNN
jgi:hydrogenase expression/formation protein HypC